MKKEEFCEALAISCEKIQISDEIRSEANRILSIKINDHQFKGTDLRSKLNLRSTDLTFEISNDEVKIISYGYGHGVGMSQYGANGMAKEGKNYHDIFNALLSKCENIPNFLV